MKEVLSFLFTASPFFSITLSQGLLIVAILYTVFLIFRKKVLNPPPFFFPLLLFALLTLISAFASVERSKSLKDSAQELFIYLLPFAAVQLDRKWLRNGIILGGAVSALLGIVRFFVIGEDRLTGFVGHYMTEGGLLMMTLLFLLALLLFEGPASPVLIAAGLSSVALLLTLTRSAWVGAFAGLAVLLYYRKKPLVLALPLLALLAYFVSPAPVKERARSIFSLNYATNKDRICMWKSGLKIIKDYPLLGSGPNTIEDLYPRYREKDAVQPTNPHLHNNFIQLAAERGILTLLAFIAFLILAFLHLLRLARSGVVEAKAGLAILLAFLVAGLFEYNFGDSEVKMLFLTFISLPFSAAKEQDSTSQSRS